MKFDEIRENMIISYNEKLFKVLGYSPKNSTNHRQFWKLIRLDYKIDMDITDIDSRLPELYTFDIDAMVTI